MLRDDRYSRARAEMISADSTFRIQGEIPSGPGALVRSRPRRSFFTPASVMIVGQHMGPPLLVLRYVRASNSVAEQIWLNDDFFTSFSSFSTLMHPAAFQVKM